MRVYGKYCHKRHISHAFAHFAAAAIILSNLHARKDASLRATCRVETISYPRIQFFMHQGQWISNINFSPTFYIQFMRQAVCMIIHYARVAYTIACLFISYAQHVSVHTTKALTMAVHLRSIKLNNYTVTSVCHFLKKRAPERINKTNFSYVDLCWQKTAQRAAH